MTQPEVIAYQIGPNQILPSSKEEKPSHTKTNWQRAFGVATGTASVAAAVTATGLMLGAQFDAGIATGKAAFALFGLSSTFAAMAKQSFKQPEKSRPAILIPVAA